MKRRDGSRGAVSIFLVIILVPMLVVSSLFVDASRLRLARGVASSAGDLVLNTALTNYDTQLKDLYGLFATAQDTDELYERLEDYYKTSIVSAGVKDQEADDIVSNIMNSLGSVAKTGDISDLLNMELIDFGVEKNTNLNLENASVIKKQVIEFMKYRAPINTGLSFITALNSFSTISKQTELVEKRQDYYESENDLMSNAKAAWEFINEYNKTDLVQKSSFLTDLQNLLNDQDQNSVKSILEESAKTTVKDLYHGQLSSAYVYGCGLSAVKIKDDTVYKLKGSNGNNLKNVSDYNTYSDDNQCPSDKIKEALTNYEKALNNYIEKKNTYINNVEPYFENGNYDLQVIAQVIDSNSKRGRSITSDFVNAMVGKDGLYHKYAYLMHCMKYTDDKVKTEEYVTINGRNMTVGDAYNLFKEDFPNTEKGQTGLYYDYVARIRKYNSFFAITGNEVTIPTRSNSNAVHNKIKNMHNKIQSYLDVLDTAKTNLSSAISKLEKVLDCLKTVNQKKNNWKAVANDSSVKNTNLAKQDRSEIDSLDKNINADDINKLISRLSGIKSNIESVINGIKSYKYMNKAITSFDSFDSLRNAMNAHSEIGSEKLKNAPLNLTELNAKANEYSQNKYVSGKIDISWMKDPDKSPILHGQGVNTLNFYAYLYTKFNTGVVSTNTTKKTADKSNGEDVYKSVKKLKDVSSKAKDPSSMQTELSGDKSSGTKDDGKAASTNNEIANISNKPSRNVGKGTYVTVELGDDPVSGTSSSLATMFKSLGNALKNAGEDLRDNLLYADYVMSMFSYDTVHKELAVKNANGNIPVKDQKTVATTSTRTPIDADHNFAHRREVEYIIYGGKNAGNVAKAYTSIYGIRLAFNLIYAFTDSEIRDTAFAIATPASAATLGVVPAPLIQAAIIIGVACIESGLDIIALSNGEKVVLMKNKDTWQTSMRGLLNNAKTVAGQIGVKVGSNLIDAGASKLNELLDMTDVQFKEYIESGGESINNIVNTLETTASDIVENCSQSVIQKLSATINTAIENDKYTSFTEVSVDRIRDNVMAEIEKWANEESSQYMVMGYNVKKLAVDAIGKVDVENIIKNIIACDKSDTNELDITKRINGIFDRIETSILSKTKTVIEGAKKKLSETIKGAKNGVNNTAKELKESLTNTINNTFGNIDSDSNSTMGSIIAFSYSDYLRLFLMIGLYTNEEAILLRSADAIQANMVLVTKEKDYQLSKSSVYVDLTVKVSVKPTLLALPLFADVEGNPAYKQGWYTFQETITKGY